MIPVPFFILLSFLERDSEPLQCNTLLLQTTATSQSLGGRMDLSLMNLRRYAIDNRVEIRFVEPGSNCLCLIDNKGLVKIPTGAQTIRVEDILAVAESFEIAGKDKPQKLTRDQLAHTVAETFKKRGFAAATKEEED
jgi:hypothetical protein